MSLLRRASLTALRNFRTRSDGPKGGYYSQGSRTDRNGFLFSETPLAKGETRKWESWELGWYTLIVGGGALLAFGLPARPETSYVGAAHVEAVKRLEESGTL